VSIVHRILERPEVFDFSQKLNPMTVSLYRELVTEYVRVPQGGRVLDIGCGVGAHRPLFSGVDYLGVDINPAYITEATRRFGTGFRVMDAGALDCPDDSYDAVFTVATCHHIDDATARSMMREALRVLRPGRAMHVVEPVLPVSSRAVIKRAIFRADRGQYQRTLTELTSLLGGLNGRVTRVDLRAGMLHDVSYVRVER
jgi:SAM-dependent methyltransferase